MVFVFSSIVVHTSAGLPQLIFNFFSKRPPPLQAPRWNVKRVSYQSACDSYPESLPDVVVWFNAAGNPWYYSAWRVKLGPIPPETVHRAELVMNAVRVACWPSLGGVWIKQAALAELDFLGLDRWSDTLRRFSINRTEENEFARSCKRLAQSAGTYLHILKTDNIWVGSNPGGLRWRGALSWTSPETI